MPDGAHSSPDASHAAARDAALARAENDCRLRAAMLLLEPEMPGELAAGLQAAFAKHVRAWLLSDREAPTPTAFLTSFQAFVRALDARAGLQAAGARRT
jgi:hypothetical protein